MGMKLCTTHKSSEPFFFSGNLVQAPQLDDIHAIMLASFSLGSTSSVNALSFGVYLGNFPIMGLAPGMRSIMCSMRSVGFISCIVPVKQFFHV